VPAGGPHSVASTPAPPPVPLFAPGSLLSAARPVVGPGPPGSVLPPVSVPRPVGQPSTMPTARFVPGFDPTVPPPALIPPMLVTSVNETPSSRPAEDMDLDNSTSSEDDLGEGFDEEWPICSRRTSSRSRGSTQYDPFIRDQRNESKASGSSLHENPLGQYKDHFRMGFEQPNTNQMFDKSAPVSSNNFATSSAPAPFDHMTPVSGPVASLGGPSPVRSLMSLPNPGTVVPGIPGAPGSINPTDGSVLSGLSDVDLRNSSYGGPLVGPPQERMVPPPLPPLLRPPTSGPAWPLIDSSLALPSGRCDGVASSGYNNTATPGPRLPGAAYPGTVPAVPSNVGGLPGPVQPSGNSADVHGMNIMMRGPDDVPVRPRFVNPGAEPANVRPFGQQVVMPGNMGVNPGMMPLVRCPVPSTGSVPTRPGDVQLSNFAGGSAVPMNMANSGSVRGPSEFGGVGIRNIVPPDSARFGLQPEMLRIQAPPPSSFPPGVNNADLRPLGPLPLGPPPRLDQLASQNTAGQLMATATEQNASLSGPSDRLISALHSLAGMQTDTPKDHPPFGNAGGSRTGFTDTRYAGSSDVGVRQLAPGSLFRPQVDVTSGFGARSLLPEQSGADAVGHRGGFPAPPRLPAAHPRFPLSGNVNGFVQIVCLSLSVIAERAGSFV